MLPARHVAHKLSAWQRHPFKSWVLYIILVELSQML